MNVYQFVGYLTAELILTGAITFAVVLSAFRVYDWWADR